MTHEERWNEKYKLAKDFYDENGHLHILPSDDIKLCDWIRNQRKVRRKMITEGKQDGALTEERIKKLDAIGMDWNPDRTTWDAHYNLAKAFYKKHGHLHVSPSDDEALNQWLVAQRQAKKGHGFSVITEEQIQLLDEIDMDWDFYETLWDESYRFAEQYYEEHGNLDVPRNYIINGNALGKWINTQRNSRKGIGSCNLTKKRIRKLDKIGMIWEKKKRTPFTQMPISKKNTAYYQKKLLIKLNQALKEMNQEQQFFYIEDVKEIEIAFVKKLK